MENRKIENLDIVDISDEKIKELESMADVSNEKLEQKKNIVTNKIGNTHECYKNVEAMLQENEEIKYKFGGVMGGLLYFASLHAYEYSYLPAISMRDLGTNYLVYVTDRRLFIFEVSSVYRIKRSYVFAYNEIVKFKYKFRKSYVKFDLKVADDTKNDMREVYFLYTGYFKNRITINSADKDAKEIAGFIKEKVGS